LEPEIEPSTTRNMSMKPRIQFVTMQGYALHSSKRAKRTKPNVAGILGEVERKAGYCRHLPRPKPPLYLRGAVSGLQAMLTEGASNARDPRNRVQRKDAQVLLTVIPSFPIRWEDFEDEDWGLLDEWVERTIRWADRNWSGRVAAVVMHVDEPRPHLHILIHDHGRNIKPLHPGHRAGKEYKAAMRALQTEFHREVGEPCGFARNGETPAMRKCGSVGSYKRYKKAWERGRTQVEPPRTRPLPKPRPYAIPGRWPR
jgi:hypothetical protein